MSPDTQLTLKDWIVAQLGRSDEIGLLAKYIQECPDWPQSEEKSVLRQFLRGRGQTSHVAALAKAIKDYEMREGGNLKNAARDRTQKVLWVGNKVMTELRTDPLDFTKDIETSEAVCKYFEENGEPAIGLFKKVISTIPTGDWSACRVAAFYLFADRLMHGPHNILFQVSNNPLFAFPDGGAIARSMLESAVNAILILQDSNNEFTARLYQASFEEDDKKRKELKTFENHPTPEISLAVPAELKRVKKSIESEEAILKSLGSTERPKALETLKDRCKKAGDPWAFLYTTRYRLFCAWSHGHMDSAMFSPFLAFSQGTDYKEAIGRGISVAHFGFHLLNLFMMEVNQTLNQPNEEVEKLYTEQGRDITKILENCSFMETPIRDSQGRNVKGQRAQKASFKWPHKK